MNPEDEFFVLRELVIGGKYEWAIYLSAEQAQHAAAAQFDAELVWGEFQEDADFGTQAMRDSLEQLAILRVQPGKFYTAYEG